MIKKVDQVLENNQNIFMAGTEKTTFTVRPGAELVSGPDHLNQILKRSPHTQGLDVVHTVGFANETGAVVHVNGHVFAGVRHPGRIPQSVGPDGVIFGATPTSDHCEGSLLRANGMDAAQKDAEQFIKELHHFGLKPTTLRREGPLHAGTESEMWAYTQDGSPFPLPHEHQEELHAHVWETATTPNLSPNQQARALAQDMLWRTNEVHNGVFNNTSMPVVGSPDSLEINTNPGQKGQYVWAVQQDLFDRHLDPRDEIARTLWDQIAQRYGYGNFDNMKQSVGNLSVWACSAAHVSIGLSHERDHQGKNLFGSVEEAIAIADLFNSDLATVAEFMTYSTPVVFGMRPELTDGEGGIHHPKDARAALRYAMTTTYPSAFVEDSPTLRDRVTHAMVEGIADRLDRSAYITQFTDRGEVTEEPAAHGRVRIRMAYGPMDTLAEKGTGRIEFVGCGSTPDIVALVSRNAFLQLMGIYAHEALAHGQYPKEYGAAEFPLMTSWQKQRDLSHRYNFVGPNDEQVNDLIQQGKRFVEYMSESYRDHVTQQLVILARYGMDRLTQTTEAENLEEFLTNPKGSISDVIAKMLNDGTSPTEIALAIHTYQLEQAKMILENDGIITSKHVINS